MREILFRAKRVKNCDWIEGDLINGAITQNVYINGHEAKIETVGQYTGLKDINGTNIFEGDIVRCKMKYKGEILSHMGVIVYDNDFGSYGTKNDAGITLLYNHYLNTFEVVGNIHDKEETKWLYK